MKIVTQSPDEANTSSAQIEEDTNLSRQTSQWVAADLNDTFQCAVDAEMETMKLVAESRHEGNTSSAQAQCNGEKAQNLGMEALFDDPLQMAQESVSLKYTNGCRGKKNPLDNH